MSNCDNLLINIIKHIISVSFQKRLAMYFSNFRPTSMLLINVVSRATLNNIDPKRSFKNIDTIVVSSGILAIIGR